MGCAKDKVDVLTATCSELQKLLTEGEIKSTDLVDLYLAQIEKHNHQGLKLNAMISTTHRSKALAIAEALDRERAAGKVRGPLHGIPLSVKVRKILRILRSPCLVFNLGQHLYTLIFWDGYNVWEFCLGWSEA
jgi:hypothetical protein